MLEMSVRWSSTYKMLETAILCEPAIDGVCAVQDVDRSMKAPRFATEVWAVVKSFKDLSETFVKPTRSQIS